MIGDYVLYFLKQLILIFLYVVDFAMLLRAIFSWFDPMMEGGFSVFLFTVTEPLILPFRVLFDKLKWFQGSPLDVPFFATILVIMLLQSLIQMI